MSPRLRFKNSEDLIIEFGGRANDEALTRFRQVCNRVPQLSHKDVTLVLESRDAFLPGLLDLLRHLSARASRCTLRLVGQGATARRA